MRNKERSDLACYMVGGFEIVDYSESINNLHKKLLTKILLNKWAKLNKRIIQYQFKIYDFTNY